jgi:hypothetical protein
MADKIKSLRVSKRITTETDEDTYKVTLERGEIEVTIRYSEQTNLDLNLTYGDEVNLIIEYPQKKLNQSDE